MNDLMTTAEEIREGSRIIDSPNTTPFQCNVILVRNLVDNLIAYFYRQTSELPPLSFKMTRLPLKIVKVVF
jgi:hypothetical protein